MPKAPRKPREPAPIPIEIIQGTDPVDLAELDHAVAALLLSLLEGSGTE